LRDDNTVGSMSQILLAGQSYRNFIEAVPSMSSRLVYRNSLQLYMQYRKIEDCSLLLKGDLKLIEQQIIDYIIYLREELKLARPTINSRIAAIKKFYETNDVELRWKKICSYVGRGAIRRSKKDRPYTRSEIMKMLEKADQRGRILILLMSSAGLRVGALSSLKIRDLERIEEYGLYKITVYENEEEEYITFCTPECAKEIDSYLEYRQRQGERPLKEDSPLIREEFDIHDEIRAARPKPLDAQTFRKLVRIIGIKSGVMVSRPAVANGRHEARPVKETHGFRKYFQTTAINAGMSPIYSELLMGHTSGGLALESYVRPSEKDLLEGNDKMIGYVGIIDALTINEENKLRRRVETLTEKQDEIQKMKDKHEQEMKSMREEMNQIITMIQHNPKLAHVKPEALAKKA
jgi:integrase